LIGTNYCDFDCCVHQEDDYNTQAGFVFGSGFGFGLDDVDVDVDVDVDFNSNTYQHAYVRVVPRSFVVDEHTGDVFVSWEGFYKDCRRSPSNSDDDDSIIYSVVNSKSKKKNST